MDSAGPPAARRLRNASASFTALGSRPSRGRLDDVTDPALDEGQRGLQPAQRGALLLGVLLGEDALQRDTLHRARIARVDLAHRLFDRFPVDPDAPGVGLDGVEDVAAKPRDVAEESLVCRFAESHEQAQL